MSATETPSVLSGRNAEPSRLHPATMLITIIREAPSTLVGVPAFLAIGARADLWLVLAGTVAALIVAGAAHRRLGGLGIVPTSSARWLA